MFKACAVIPTYNNPRTLREVVARVGEVVPVVVADDASGPEARAVAHKIAQESLADVVFRVTNGGKGAAVKTALQRAQELGYTHAIQVDADMQHELTDVPKFLRLAEQHPNALVLGQPVFDASAPWGRKIARNLSILWTFLEIGGDAVGDPLCGFRVYPIAAAVAAQTRGDRMDFDPEIAVRMVWNGVPTLKVPTHVRYVSQDAGGVSHFKVGLDNWLISKMHTRLMLEKIFLRWPARLAASLRALPAGR